MTADLSLHMPSIYLFLDTVYRVFQKQQAKMDIKSSITINKGTLPIDRTAPDRASTNFKIFDVQTSTKRWFWKSGQKIVEVWTENCGV